jgi:hypothetical protein
MSQENIEIVKRAFDGFAGGGLDATLRQPIGAVYFDFRDGRVGAIRFFLTWKQILEAMAPG